MLRLIPNKQIMDLRHSLVEKIPHAREMPELASSNSIFLESLLVPGRQAQIYINFKRRNQVYLTQGPDQILSFDCFAALIAVPTTFEVIELWLTGQSLLTIRKILEAEPDIQVGNYKDSIVLQQKNVLLGALPQASPDVFYDDEGEPTTFYLRSVLLPEREIAVDVSQCNNDEIHTSISLEVRDTDFDGMPTYVPYFEFEANELAGAVDIIAEWFSGQSIKQAIETIKTRINLLKKYEFLIDVD